MGLVEGQPRNLAELLANIEEQKQQGADVGAIWPTWALELARRQVVESLAADPRAAIVMAREAAAALLEEAGRIPAFGGWTARNAADVNEAVSDVRAASQEAVLIPGTSAIRVLTAVIATRLALARVLKGAEGLPPGFLEFLEQLEAPE